MLNIINIEVMNYNSLTLFQSNQKFLYEYLCAQVLHTTHQTLQYMTLIVGTPNHAIFLQIKTCATANAVGGYIISTVVPKPSASTGRTKTGPASGGAGLDGG